MVLSERVEKIKQLAESKGLTAYRIGKDTEISAVSVMKIFTGQQKNPRKLTLDIIENYVTYLDGYTGKMKLTDDNLKLNISEALLEKLDALCDKEQRTRKNMIETLILNHG